MNNLKVCVMQCLCLCRKIGKVIKMKTISQGLPSFLRWFLSCGEYFEDRDVKYVGRGWWALGDNGFIFEALFL